MITREWAAIHRKHHAKCETAADPHSPQVFGINRVLWTGVFLYVRESRNADTLERYGHGTPDDWLERKVYARPYKFGILLMLGIDLALFGIWPGIPDLGRADGLDPLLGGRGGEWHRALLGLSEFRLRRCLDKFLSARHPDRRRGTAQQPPRIRNLGQAFQQVVRVRHRLDVHLRHGKARSRAGEENRAKASAGRGASDDRRRVAAGGFHTPLRRPGKVHKGAAPAGGRGIRPTEDRCARRAHDEAPARSGRCCPARRRRQERLAGLLARSERLSRGYAMRAELEALWARSAASHDQLVSAVAGLGGARRAKRDSPAGRVFACACGAMRPEVAA
jgi:hypothetical protein